MTMTQIGGALCVLAFVLNMVAFMNNRATSQRLRDVDQELARQREELVNAAKSARPSEPVVTPPREYVGWMSESRTPRVGTWWYATPDGSSEVEVTDAIPIDWDPPDDAVRVGPLGKFLRRGRTVDPYQLGLSTGGEDELDELGDDR